jgi:predicted enzyme related to lactoylglutathione lyase
MTAAPSALPAALPPGTPCWVELATVDERTAQRFYGELFGWEFTTNRDPVTLNRRYDLAHCRGRPAAGVYRAAERQQRGWILHLAVHNTDSTAEWVERLGGRVTLGPAHIPARGSILHALDAAGAPVVFWQAPPGWDFASGTPWTLSGADLNTHDGASADSFYCRLFNFTSEQIGRGDIDYAEWRLNGNAVLYRYVMHPAQAALPPHWMLYFAVDPARGADAVAGHALMLGGSVLTEPFDTPFGRTVVLADPDGAVFSIIDHSRVVVGPGRAEVDDPDD